MTEYEARIRDFASSINEVRSSTGSTATTIMFALISVLLAKNKITDRDVDIIFDVESKQSENTMRSYFDQGYGDPDFEIKNEKELEDAKKYLLEYVDSIKENVKNAAKLLKPQRKKREDGSTRAQSQV